MPMSTPELFTILGTIIAVGVAHAALMLTLYRLLDKAPRQG